MCVCVVISWMALDSRAATGAKASSDLATTTTTSRWLGRTELSGGCIVALFTLSVCAVRTGHCRLAQLGNARLHLLCIYNSNGNWVREFRTNYGESSICLVPVIGDNAHPPPPHMLIYMACAFAFFRLITYIFYF